MCVFQRELQILSCIYFEGECKNICGTQFSRYLFSARSYMVNYVYYLACLYFGIQLYVSCSFVFVLRVCERHNPQSDFIARLMSKKQGSSVPSVNLSDATIVAFH